MGLAEHALWDRWVILPSPHGFGALPAGTLAVGYVYIDHFCGTSLWVNAFVVPVQGALDVLLRPQEDAGTLFRFRYESGWPGVRHLGDGERKGLALLSTPCEPPVSRMTCAFVSMAKSCGAVSRASARMGGSRPCS